MITLSFKDGGEVIGSIDEADLQFLADQLVEETDEDTDYYIDPTTVDFLEQHGAGTELISLLREAIGDSEGVEITWTES